METLDQYKPRNLSEYYSGGSDPFRLVLSLYGYEICLISHMVLMCAMLGTPGLGSDKPSSSSQPSSCKSSATSEAVVE